MNHSILEKLKFQEVGVDSDALTHNGSPVQRPSKGFSGQGTRFLFAVHRELVCFGNTFIIFGLFPWDLQTPDHSWVLLVNPNVPVRNASYLQN